MNDASVAVPAWLADTETVDPQAEPPQPEQPCPVPLAVYVDVDETMLRDYGQRQIPIPAVIRQIKALYRQGAELYCWSSGGAAHARQCAEACGVAECFQAFLPKPQVLIDDQQPGQWRRTLHVHPAQCSSQTTLDEYREDLRPCRPATPEATKPEPAPLPKRDLFS
ncbi:hypothetical protein [Deinococcus sonorensis]|uniref:DUF705 domain-containing protein n=2 Tax=Deinococcus sonorensis TaxID=309891 RepID=A0AAU7UB11_9DEIO